MGQARPLSHSKQFQSQGLSLFTSDSVCKGLIGIQGWNLLVWKVLGWGSDNSTYRCCQLS